MTALRFDTGNIEYPQEARILAYVMIALSEIHFASRWAPHLSLRLWSDRGILTHAERMMLNFAVTRAGGYWSDLHFGPDSDNQPKFISIEAWQEALRLHQKAG